MKDDNKAENESEEVGQHVLLAQVFFFRALLVFYMLCMPYIPFLFLAYLTMQPDYGLEKTSLSCICIVEKQAYGRLFS